MKRTDQKTVFVGLSGGVDSSVAALRLKRAGFRVVGVFIKVWQPDFLDCNWEQERLDAMRVAAHLDIPFLTCDAEAEYKREVGDYFIREYLEGRTPNPDVMCNRYVKFGAFWRFAKEQGADFIATGHYARRLEDSGDYALLRGIDHNKDQSYFLWTLNSGDLAHILFPIGDTTKEAVRKEAAEAGLPTAIKKDSQGICFLGQVDIPEFIGHFTKLEPGLVQNRKGKRIGTHQGALVYTLGQRHGLTIEATDKETGAHYVVDRDLSRNIVIVDTKPPQLEENKIILLKDVNFVGEKPLDELTVLIQFRYRQTPVRAILKLVEGGWTVVAESIVTTPASGQSVVFYDGEKILGGGVIK